MKEVEPHPYADKFPMLPEPELAELAESIAANGLRSPIVLTTDGLILDGRNRYAACQLIGVEPETVTYEGEDLAEYVIDCNVTRRNMSTGARAMSTALVLAADGRRNDGRWKRGSVDATSTGGTSGWSQRLAECGVIIDFKPDLAESVVIGERDLKNAFAEADAIRTSEQRDEILDRERRKREKDEAREQAERNAQIVTDLTQSESPFLADIETERMTPAVAWAAHQEATRKERRNQEELDHGIRSTVTRIAECVRYLDGGKEQADIFLKGFYPHEHRFLAEGMRLTPARVRSCIEFLTTIENGITK